MRTGLSGCSRTNSYRRKMDEMMICNSMEAKLRPTQPLPYPHKQSEITMTIKPSPNSPRSKRKRVERFLHSRLVLLEPSLGPEVVCILPPDCPVTMNGVTRNAQDSICREILSLNGESSFWNQTGETYGACGMNTKSLIDRSLEISQPFHLLECGGG